MFPAFFFSQPKMRENQLELWIRTKIEWDSGRHKVITLPTVSEMTTKEKLAYILDIVYSKLALVRWAEDVASLA